MCVLTVLLLIIWSEKLVGVVKHLHVRKTHLLTGYFNLKFKL